MNTFIITFGVFLAVIAAMSIGYIIQKKVVKGSCGGLGAVGFGVSRGGDSPLAAASQTSAGTHLGHW